MKYKWFKTTNKKTTGLTTNSLTKASRIFTLCLYILLVGSGAKLTTITISTITTITKAATFK